MLGEQNELREFAVYGAAALAYNGRPPDDLEQRMIVIELQRRKAGDEVAELRVYCCVPLDRLARMAGAGPTTTIRCREDRSGHARPDKPCCGQLAPAVRYRRGDRWGLA